MSARNRKPWLAYAIGAAIMIAGAYLAFELGRYRAGYSVMDHRRERADLEQRLAEERAAGEELRRQLAILETSREIDRETYAEIEASLSGLQATIQAQEEELVFYRGIVSPQDGVAGLRTQSLEVLPTDDERRYLLRLVLVQAIVHSRRVAGAVRLDLEGMHDGRTASFDVEELAVPEGGCDMAYGFRYFQGLECELALPVGFEPGRINVEIWPSEPRSDRVTQTFEWSSVLE